jgi:hypothetical protein
MRPPLLPLLLLLTLVLPLTAQRRDVRLSPPEPVTYALPDSIRIEAADRLGDLTLVVWGTNTRAGGDLRNLLRAQIVRGGRAIGIPRPIHAPDARPSRFVSVVAAESDFIVLWNDQRADSVGLYAVMVDQDGIVVGHEQRVGGLARGTVVIGSGTTQSVLSMHEGFGILHRRGQDGSPMRLHDTILGDVRRVARLEHVIGGTLLEVDGRWLLVDRDGNIQSNVLPAVPAGAAWWVRPDGRVLALIGDSLREFSSIVDTFYTPLGTISRTGRIAGSEVVGVDSVGQPFVACIRLFSNPSLYSMDVVRWRFDLGAVARTDTMVRWTVGDYFDHYPNRARVNRASRSNGDDNSSLVSVSLTGWQENLPLSDYEFFVSLTVYSTGSLRYVSDEDALVYNAGQRARLRRTSGDTASTIEVVISSDTARVTTTTSWTPLDIQQRGPSVFETGGHRRVGWWVGGWPRPLRNVVSEWSVSADTIRGQLYEFTRSAVISSPLLESYSSSESHLVSDGAVTMVSGHSARIRNVDQRIVDRIRVESYAAYVPTESGWRGGVIAEYNADWPLYELAAMTPTYDPNSRSHLFAATVYYRTYEPSKWMVVSLDSLGVRHVIAEVLLPTTTRAAVMAGDTGEIMLADPSGVRVISGDSTLARLAFARPMWPVRFIRLRGRQFLRTWVDTNAREQLHFELYDLDTGFVTARTLNSDRRISFYHVAQSRSDSSLFILYNSDGVRVNRYSALLRDMWQRVAVSETRNDVGPLAAIVLDDTLNAVWENYHDGRIDIYGTALPISAIPSRVEVPHISRRALLGTVSPVPAIDRIDVALASEHEIDARLELFDVSGQLRVGAVIEPGHLHASLALDGCSSGVYLLVARAGDRVEERRVIVVR